DAHCGGDGNAYRSAVRTVRRHRMGAVARAGASRHVDRASMPAVRTGRLRRRQGLRVPGHAAGRDRLMRLALIRQRYTPYGGAERFVEGALEALLERDVAITLYTRE